MKFYIYIYINFFYINATNVILFNFSEKLTSNLIYWFFVVKPFWFLIIDFYRIIEIS